MGTTIVRPPAFERADVSDAMHPGVITCEPDAPLRMLAGIMAAEQVHCVVIDANGDGEATAQWSIVSDLDLVNAVSENRFEERTAASAAVSEFLTVTSDEKLHRAAQIMTEHELTHLVVIDKASGRPEGILSTLDIARVLAWGNE